MEILKFYAFEFWNLAKDCLFHRNQLKADLTRIGKSFIRETIVIRFFDPREDFAEVFLIYKSWLGQEKEEKRYDKGSEQRKNYLDTMLQVGVITEEKHKEYLSPQE